jgi:hypothetical protein
MNKATSYPANEIDEFEGNIVDAFVDAMDEAGLNNLDGIDLCVGCMFDIKLMDGALVELKSYAPSTLVAMKNSTKFINQFKTYLQSDKLQYWFNGLKGVSVADVKAGFKELYLKPNMWNTLTGNTSPPTIPPSWIDPLTPGSPITNETEFLAAINDYNSRLYQHINIQ